MASLTQNFKEAVGILMADNMAMLADPSQDAILKQFPFGYVDADQVFYDQYENSYGLVNLRGLGGSPDVTQFPGWKRYTAAPAYLGDAGVLDEETITKGVDPGTLADPLSIGKRLGLYTLNASKRILDLVRLWAAQLVYTGYIRQTDSKGRVFEYQLANYTNQIKVPSTPWFTNGTTSTPVTDMLGYQAALQKGTDSRFGGDSVLLANSITIANFFGITSIQNTYKTDYGATINGLEKFNKQVAGGTSKQGFELPQIQRYDEGYYANQTDAQNSQNFNYFIPTGTFLWFGTRPRGEKLSQWQLTRHAGLVLKGDDDYGTVSPGPDTPAIEQGLYINCHVKKEQPHGYLLETGLNGLPIIFFPSAFAAIVTS